jgi:septal ring factor EnvC (AmiA/AmiB activator)
MKSKGTRGMRDIPTIQGLRHCSLPTTREQTVAEVARLEHERARLERELDMWLENQKKTESRLQHVQERLSYLQQVLEPPIAVCDPQADDSTKLSGTRRSSAAETNRGEGDGQGWREIQWGY